MHLNIYRHHETSYRDFMLLSSKRMNITVQKRKRECEWKRVGTLHCVCVAEQKNLEIAFYMRPNYQRISLTLFRLNELKPKRAEIRRNKERNVNAKIPNLTSLRVFSLCAFVCVCACVLFLFQPFVSFLFCATHLKRLRFDFTFWAFVEIEIRHFVSHNIELHFWLCRFFACSLHVLNQPNSVNNIFKRMRNIDYHIFRAILICLVFRSLYYFGKFFHKATARDGFQCV